tara:strand:- start:80 stop:793 length:714 start_codon:yes stop_codon:yes gene_type:complete
MWSTLYYIFGASAVSTISFGLLYYLDRPKAQQLTQELSWNTVKLYHKLNLECSKIKKLYCPDNIKESKSDDEMEDDFEVIGDYEFIGYNLGNIHITKYSSFKIENNNYINDTDFDLMFLKKNDTKLYKRLKNKDDISSDTDISKVDKPFIQVELSLENMDENITIHKNLECFYVNDNDILDKTFLTWYVKTFYDITLNENYKLNIIDSDINMFNINKEEYLQIKTRDKSNYQIMQIE